MAYRKRKAGRETDNKKDKVHKNRRLTHTTNLKNGTNKQKEIKVKKFTGPRLPAKFREAINILNPKLTEDEVIDSNDIEREGDVYEYEEEMPQEESKKNRRFDTVDNYEYELPDSFEDEDVLSEDDEEEDLGPFKEKLDEKIMEVKGGIGSTTDVYEGDKMESGDDDILETDDLNTIEAYGGDHVSFNDLLAPLQGNPGFSRLRKMMHEVEQKSAPIHAPLPKPEEERVERKAAYMLSNKDITKWESRVKSNREAPTVYFDTKVSFPPPTVEIVASRFEPRTEFEKKMASILHHEKIMQAFSEDGARLLELNKVSVEDVKDRQNSLSKMRSLLFQHEMKAKRIKKIKSKTYHRILKRQRQKNLTYVDSQLDPEAAKKLAIKQEFKRAEERMTRRHMNTSRWATRVLHRGLNIQDEGTRAAISEQLHQHTILTRKMKSMKDGSSSSGESSDEGDEESSGSDRKKESKLLKRAKQKTLQEVETEDAAAPKSGVLSLPFMVRGMKKTQMAAVEEAKLAVQEYEASIRKLDGTGRSDGKAGKVVTGRRVFNPPVKDAQADNVRDPSRENGSDSESGREAGMKRGSPEKRKEAVVMENSRIDLRFLREGSEEELEEPVLEKIADIISRSPLRPKPKYGVSICGSGAGMREKAETVDACAAKCSPEVKPALDGLQLKEEKRGVEEEEEEKEGSEESEESDMDGVRMVEGMLTRVGGEEYKLPSQGELIEMAFAGDDVADEFRREKEAVVDQENPKAEEPILLPGWGEWSTVQRKRGLPSWMVKKHEAAMIKREEALERRKDAHLNHIFISERPDKKAEKLQMESTPYPYTSKEVFEQSIRMPMGPEFNPATAIGDLHRPAVVKRPGVIINPIKFKQVNPHEEDEKEKRRKEKDKRKRKPKQKIVLKNYK